eukprot:14013824-Ditylum_brightwellii.AAC.1
MMVDKFPGIKTNITGGYASWLNGKIEQPHETVKNGTRAILMDTESYYFGIINSNPLVELFDTNTNIVKPCNTAQFDEYRTHVGNDKPMPGALTIREKPVATSDLPTLTINTSDYPYFTEPPKLFKFPYQ